LLILYLAGALHSYKSGQLDKAVFEKGSITLLILYMPNHEAIYPSW